MAASEELLGTSNEAIKGEALRRSALMESGDYEYPERMDRKDLWAGVIVFVVSLVATYAGIWA